MDEKEIPAEIWFECPGCGQLGKIDEQQRRGLVSIICPCGWHGYSGEKP